MGERIDATPMGHLTVALRWCVPDALKLRSLHLAGFNIYRVSADRWQNDVGGSVPLNMDRDLLLAGLARGVIDQVNRAPAGPETDLDCPLDPESGEFFFIDANDTKALQQAEAGGSAFSNGDEVVYFAAGVSHVGVIGIPSPGLPVTVCARVPPSPPADLRMVNKHDYNEGTQTGIDFLEASWRARTPSEIPYYCIHRYRDANGALHDRATGNWPHNANLVAILDNVPDARGRMTFRDDGANEVPGAPPHPQLPVNANQTFWYTVCAIDNSACQDAEGFGTVGAPTGSVPAALYRSDGPGDAEGRVTVPCCDLVVADPVAIEPNGDARPVLTGIRNSTRIVRMDFAARLIGDDTIIPLASVVFPKDAAEKRVSAEVDVSALSDFTVLARFRTNVGRISDWIPTGPFTTPFVPDQEWAGNWVCEPKPVGTCDGVVDPVDPETGEFEEICVNLGAPPERAVEIAVYTRVNGGPMIRRHRGAYEKPLEICFHAPATPGRVCIFTQTFDKDGNPGIVFPLECVETIGHEGYPTPTITLANSLDAQIGDHTGLAALEWSSPTSGVHRFELKVTPPLPDASWIVHDSPEAGIIKKSWSFHETPSLPGGFGGAGSDFEQWLPLIIGETHTVCVRAVGAGDPGDRATGAWSDPRDLTWTPDSGGGNPPQDGVAFPIRPVPGDAPGELLSVFSPDENDIVLKDRYIWVEVGELERELVGRESIVTGGITVPAILNVGSIEPYLFFDLPLVGYLQRVDIGDKPTHQTTHFIDEILTEVVNGDQLLLIDQSFYVARKKSKSTVSIWLRMAMPPARGGVYRGTILQHHPDRETRAVHRANTVQIP